MAIFITFNINSLDKLPVFTGDYTNKISGRSLLNVGVSQ